jgi:hypothetical protein
MFWPERIGSLDESSIADCPFKRQRNEHWRCSGKKS